MVSDKTLWIYWEQGESNAPQLVHHCLSSWRRHHPSWQINVLDAENLAEFIELDWVPQAHLTLQWKTDIARLALLSKYGGVWTDATTFCTKPLEAWLPDFFQDGFFAFRSVRPDRLLQSWFIAANSDSEWLRSWKEEVFDYCLKHTFSEPGNMANVYYRKVMSLRKKALISNEIWKSRFTTRVLRFRPYPMVMFLFESALKQRQSMLDQWYMRQHLDDEICHQIQNVFGMNKPMTKQSASWLKQIAPPMHKLNWRQDLGYVEKGSHLAYLIETSE